MGATFSKLHSLHPAAQTLAQIEITFKQHEDNIIKIGKALTDIIRNEAAIILVGAGMSINSGLPNATNFIKECIDSIFENKITTNFFKKFPEEYNKWKLHLSNLEFDAILGLLKILNPNDHCELYNAFLHGLPTSDYAAILALTRLTNIRAIFSTNFDTSIEKTANQLGKKLSVYAAIDDFPESVINLEPLPLFKLHGGVSHSGKHLDIQADFFDIGREINRKRLKLLKTYLKSHHLIVMGYGGQDYWDIYPILFEQGIKGIIWISHEETNTPTITTTSECYELKRIRDNVERLLAFSPGRVRVKCKTSEIIKSIMINLDFDVPKLAIEKELSQFNWQNPIRNYFRNQRYDVLIHLGNILAACGGLDLANKAFDTAITNIPDDTHYRKKIEAYLGRVRTAVTPIYSDIEKAYELSNQYADYELTVKILIENAIAVGNYEDRNNAIFILKQAAELAIEHKLYSLGGLCFANIGHQFSKLREFRDSSDSYTESEKLLRQAGDIPNLLITLRNHAEMFAIDWAIPDVLSDALPLYLEALSLSWNRHLNYEMKMEIYTRILVILRLLYPDPKDAIDYIVRRSMLNESGLAEHLVHRIVEYGYSVKSLILEEWKHEIL